jgi:hypothetical protein
VKKDIAELTDKQGVRCEPNSRNGAKIYVAQSDEATKSHLPGGCASSLRHVIRFFLH